MQKLESKNDIDQIISELSIDEKLSLLVGGKGFASYEIKDRNIVEMTMCDSHNGINLMQRMVDVIQMVMKKKEEDNAENISKDQIIGYLFGIGRVMGGPKGMERLLQSQISESEYELMDEETKAFAKEFIALLPSVLPEGKCPVAYPVGMNMASTWNRKYMEKAGQCVGIEANANDVDILLAPTLNILRDPLCGRWFESYSEDPYLTAEMVKPYIKGVEGTGTLATPKHFACNNQETLRHEIDEMVSEKALREIYLPGFKAAISKASVLMTAYNSVNGSFCSENEYLLREILRKEWGYKGLVLSDWNGVYDKTKALKAGNNLEMPGPTTRIDLLEALKNNELSIDVIDENVRKVLETVLKTNRYRKKHKNEFDYERHIEFSKEMADESIVLLKNNDALPLLDDELTLLGEFKNNTLSCGEGSSGVISQYVVSIEEGLQKHYKLNTTIKNHPIVLVIGEKVGEGSDRENMELDKESVRLLEEIIERKGEQKLVVILNTPGPVDIHKWVGEIDGLLFIGYPGQEAGRSVSDVLRGEVNPSGKLTFTYPFNYMQTPTALNFPGEFNKVCYGEGIYVGYRYYDKKNVIPLFEFGYGLSYTTFEYSNLKVNKKMLDMEIDETLEVSVDITNTGDKKGKEVAQLYVRDRESTLDKPIKELKGFEKVKLNQGETKTLVFKLQKEAFSSYDVNLKRWVVEPGDFEILVGSSSKNIKVCTDVEVTCINPYGTSLKTPIAKLMKNTELVDRLTEILPQGFFELPGIQIELIYHPELSLEECIDKYGKEAYGMTEKQKNVYKEKIVDILGIY